MSVHPHPTHEIARQRIAELRAEADAHRLITAVATRRRGRTTRWVRQLLQHTPLRGRTGKDGSTRGLAAQPATTD